MGYRVSRKHTVVGVILIFLANVNQTEEALAEMEGLFAKLHLPREINAYSPCLKVAERATALRQIIRWVSGC